MISHGEGFVLKHRSGRYFNIWRRPFYIGNSRCEDPQRPAAYVFELVEDAMDGYWVGAADHWPRWLGQDPSWALVADQFEAAPRPGCACCGGTAFYPIRRVQDGGYRCSKHFGRNPCAIEGCQRTRAASEGQHSSSQWMCSVHWRRFVPPRSRRRQAYHAFFRQAKKHGWSTKSRLRFWRYWDLLVASARAREASGALDETAINRMFGWDE